MSVQARSASSRASSIQASVLSREVLRAADTPAGRLAWHARKLPGEVRLVQAPASRVTCVRRRLPGQRGQPPASDPQHVFTGHCVCLCQCWKHFSGARLGSHVPLREQREARGTLHPALAMTAGLYLLDPVPS